MIDTDVLLSFLNSEHFHDRSPSDENLKNPQWVQKFCEKAQISTEQLNDELESLISGRKLMREIVLEMMNNGALTNDQLQQLNSQLSSIMLKQDLERLSDGQLKLNLNTSGHESLIGKFFIAFSNLIAGDLSTRIKLCDNDTCRWAFIDESRNNSRRWCSSAHCGNVAKVRAHRARKKTAPSPETC